MWQKGRDGFTGVTLGGCRSVGDRMTSISSRLHPLGCLCGERQEDKDELCRYIKGQLQNVLFLSRDERQPGLFGPSGFLFMRINKLV